MKQNSFQTDFFFPSFLFSFPHQVWTAARRKGESQLPFLLCNPICWTQEGRKDKRSFYRKSLIRGEPAAGTLAEEPANHKGSQGGQSRSAFGQLFLFVSLHSCWTECIRYQSGILNYNMNLRHVIHVICNMFFEHFRSLFSQRMYY